MTLECPKCHASMRTYERSGVTVERCTECRGVFLDRGELEHLVDAEGRYYEGRGWRGDDERRDWRGDDERPDWRGDDERRDWRGDEEGYRERRGWRGDDEGPGWRGDAEGYRGRRGRRGFLDDLLDFG